MEIGYWVGGRGARAGARQRGGGRRASGLLRQRFPHRFIIAECRPENTASVGLLRKVGFRDTGDEGQLPGRRIFTVEPA